MTDENERIHELEIKIAVLKEKVKRLEILMYSGLGFILLQLIAMFIMWIKDVLTR